MVTSGVTTHDFIDSPTIPLTSIEPAITTLFAFADSDVLSN